ncbi:MAG: calcium/sodium antiporter [Microthrixaceae bacterium]
MIWSLLLIIVGIAALAYSSDWFVDGAAVLANRLSVPPVVIGTLVIGLGTSLPEVFVSTLAALHGDLNLGIGNIVGSNTANLTLVLGVAAMIALVRVDSEIVRREAPLMLGSCVLVAALAWRRLTLVGGLILLAGLAGYLVLTVVLARRSRNDLLAAEVAEYTEKEHRYSTRMEAGRTLVGLVGTVAAARALVVGAVDLADRVGWSGGFVGLSLVALGTSLPELAAAIQAVRRNEDELLVGNLVGSNLLNSLLVGGLVGVVGQGDEATSAVLHRGMAVMVVGVGVVTALMVTRARFERTSGALLVAAYVIAIVALGPN